MRGNKSLPELRECKEDDEEHNSESSDVLGAAAERGAELSHGLVEADVLEQLDPGEEHADGDRVVVLGKQKALNISDLP